MALKSGASHAFSTLIFTLLAAVLVQYLHRNDVFTFLFGLFGLLAEQLSVIIAVSGYSVEPLLIEYILFASIFSFIWGVVYHFVRR